MAKGQDEKSQQNNSLEAYRVVSKLIDAIYKENASNTTQERMINWFRSNVNEELKYDVFEEAMHKHLRPNKYPDDIDRKEFEVLLIRLGLDKASPQYKKKKGRKQTLSRRLIRFAAVLLPLIVIVGGCLWFGIRETEKTAGQPAFVASYQVSVPHNESKTLTLNDGTVVTLNNCSEFSYNDNRECTLKGEGYFNVAKSNKPFIIYTDNIEVTVLGTEFNLRAYPDSELSVVSLYTGTVNITFENGSHKLTRNKEFIFNNTTGEIAMRALNSDNDESKPSWLDGKKPARVYSLGKILRAIESEYGIVIENKQIPDTTQPYTFTLQKSESLDTVMLALKTASGDFDYKIKENKIIIEPVKK